MFKIIQKDLSNESTIRTPSFAKYFMEINNENDINEAIRFKNKNKLKLKLLGNGSNILFSKKYYDEILFLKLGDSYKFFNLEENFVELGSSFSLIQAGRKLVSKGYRKYIFFNLIPATIGGAVRQNAGTGFGEEIKDVCFSSKLYDIKENRIVEMSNSELLFNYRHSLIKEFPERYIILSAKFMLSDKVEDIDLLIDEMKSRVKEKSDREPKGYCFGSTFMNHEKSAWQYVSQIVDDLNPNFNVQFSKKHKNWIINDNGTTGEEVEILIKSAKKIIKKRFNIDLKVEVDII